MAAGYPRAVPCVGNGTAIDQRIEESEYVDRPLEKHRWQMADGYEKEGWTS